MPPAVSILFVGDIVGGLGRRTFAALLPGLRERLAPARDPGADEVKAELRRNTEAALQQGFQQMLEPAKKLQADYLPQMRQRASGLDAGQIMAMVRGG